MGASIGYLPGERWLVSGPAAVVYTGGGAATAMRWWPQVRAQASAVDLITSVHSDGVLGSGKPLVIACIEPEGLRVLVQGDVEVTVLTTTGTTAVISGRGLITWTEVVIPNAATVLVDTDDEQPAIDDLLPMPVGVVRAGVVRWELVASDVPDSPAVAASVKPAPAGLLSDEVAENPAVSTEQLAAASDVVPPVTSVPEPAAANADRPTTVARSLARQTPRKPATVDQPSTTAESSQQDTDTELGETIVVQPDSVGSTSAATQAGKPTWTGPLELPTSDSTQALDQTAMFDDLDHISVTPRANGAGVSTDQAQSGLPPRRASRRKAEASDPPPQSEALAPIESMPQRVDPVPPGWAGDNPLGRMLLPPFQPPPFQPSSGSPVSAQQAEHEQLSLPHQASPPQVQKSLPTAQPDVNATEAIVAAQLIYARLCPDGHPNAPQAQSCRLCGQAIGSGDAVPVARPLLGRIRMGTGETIAVDKRIVIGRAPAPVRLPVGEDARLVPVDSPNQDISRSHLEVRQEDWNIVVTDLHSTNGTTVRAPGRPEQLLHPGQTMVIQEGWVVDLGDGVTFVVEAP